MKIKNVSKKESFEKIYCSEIFLEKSINWDQIIVLLRICEDNEKINIGPSFASNLTGKGGCYKFK